jgi:hypothetical protein
MNYPKIYNQIIERAKTRQLEGYKEKHHILPKCLGGSNDKENLVGLTAREHFLCHMLLVEIYPKENKLKHALFLMAIGKQKVKERNYVIGSRVYERLKTEYSDMLKNIPKSSVTRKKISESKKGHKCYQNPEWKNNISKGRKGIKCKKYKKRKDIGLKRNPNPKTSKLLKGNTNRRKKVLQYDLKENFIKEWNFVLEAAHFLGKNQGAGITEVCNGKRKSIYGYIWKYKK